jgi:hypothetical protein
MIDADRCGHPLMVCSNVGICVKWSLGFRSCFQGDPECLRRILDSLMNSVEILAKYPIGHCGIVPMFDTRAQIRFSPGIHRSA